MNEDANWTDYCTAIKDANWTVYCTAIKDANYTYKYNEYFLAWVLATKRAATKYLVAKGYRQPKPEAITLS